MTALIPLRQGSRRRGLGRALLTALIGQVALFAFDTVAHASDGVPTAALPGNHCVVAASEPAPDAIATMAPASAVGDSGGDQAAGLVTGGHDGEDETEHGAGHGALASCLALLGAGIALAFRARWWSRTPLTTVQCGASCGLISPARVLSAARLRFLDLGMLRL